jgi:phosphate transport system permease protein
MSTPDIPKDLFQHRRTRAKSLQSFFFWLFRIFTYLIILAASYLFLKITKEGLITVLQPAFPFVNVDFFVQRPQTLYVFQWDDDALSEAQLAAVAAVEDSIRKEIPEKEAYYQDAIAQAELNKAEISTKLHEVNLGIARTKKALHRVQKREEKATKAIQKLDRQQQRMFDRDAPEAELDVKREEILASLEARKDIFREKAAVEKERADLAALKNQLASRLPGALKKESETVLANLHASLAWPAPGFFEKQNAQEKRINAAFDKDLAKLEKRYAAWIDRKTDALQKKKVEDRRKDKIAALETAREQALTKAQSYEAGDMEYRGVYARKAEAADVKVRSYSYSGGGIFPAIVGTILLTLGSMTIALILGILSAIYLSEYAKPGTFLNLIRLSILNLAGVPSIVFGLFGFGMFVIFFDWNVSLLAGCFTLAFMVLPVIITASEESLRAIPQGFREGSLALGATKWTSIRTNVLPYALPGILTSSVLGVARVAGETAPIMFTAAYALRDNLPWEGLDKASDFFFQGVMALPYHIYVVSSKIPQNAYTERMQYGTAFVFLIIVAGIALTSILLRIRMRKKYKW